MYILDYFRSNRNQANLSYYFIRTFIGGPLVDMYTKQYYGSVVSNCAIVFATLGN